jgi:hypothetical protein
MFDSIQSPEIFGSMIALGSPGAVYATLSGVVEATVPGVELRSELIGGDACRVSIRFKDGNDPFREYCSLQIGLYACVPILFGYGEAEITIESCQCDGAPWCQALVHWDSVDDVAARASGAELRARVAEARLEEIQHCVAELVSGDELETVLANVVVAAARAVTALSYVLEVRKSVTADRSLYCQGVVTDEGAEILQRLTEAQGTQMTPYMCRVDVVSDRSHYGQLVAVRSGAAWFEPLERSVLESYGRLAASALDSHAVIAEAHQHATTAEALLSLSSSLSDLASTEEMMLRLAQAVPSVIDCDRVAICLTEPDSDVATVSATYGFDRATDVELRSRPPPWTIYRWARKLPSPIRSPTTVRCTAG